MTYLRKNCVLVLAAAGLLAWPLLSACSDDDSTSCTPSQEICNGWDDDCDGQTDEDNVCCEPQAEECNGLDDDCDGDTDEGGSTGQLRRQCNTACGDGYEYCFDGQWEQCDAPAPANDDSQCNGLDDDCDGSTDEDCNCVHGATRPCGTNEGVCEEGTEDCANGNWSGNCTGGVQPANDDSNCNGLDDDCDTQIDEDCSCTPTDTQPCGSDVGTCRKGTQTCQGGGTWGTCANEVGPGTETCDGTDNDCNGTIDDNIPGDNYEINDTCAQFRDLGEVWEDDGPSNFTATLNPQNDLDWYHVKATEATHLGCSWGDPQCYEFWADVTIPNNLNSSDVLVTLMYSWLNDCTDIDGAFDSDNDGLWSGQTWSILLRWEGTCNPIFTDSLDFFVTVEAENNTWSCYDYTMIFEMTEYGDQEACP